MSMTEEQPIVTPGTRIVGLGIHLPTDLIRHIIDTYDHSDAAAEVIRAIHGIPETAAARPEEANVTHNTTMNLGVFGFWLALGAVAVAWILTHSA